MLYDLKAHYCIIVIGSNASKGRNNRLLKGDIWKSAPQIRNDLRYFVQPMIRIHLTKQYLHSPAFSTTDFQQITTYQRLGGNVCFQKPLMNWVVTDQLIGGNFRCIGSHLKFHYFGQK